MRFLDKLDLKSGVVLGIYSLSMIAMSVWATLSEKDLPAGVVTAYLGVVAAKTGHSMVVKKSEGGKIQPPEVG